MIVPADTQQRYRRSSSRLPAVVKAAAWLLTLGILLPAVACGDAAPETGEARQEPAAEASVESDTLAEQLLARAMAFHDPAGSWNTRPLTMTWSGTGDDGAERLRLEMTTDPAVFGFGLSGHYRGTQLEYSVREGEVQVTVDGSSEIDAELRKKLVLDREDGLFWRNYFGFLAGFPMNVGDPGAELDPEVVPTEFMGQAVEALTVRYPAEAGADIWTYYFLPSGQNVGVRFDRADPTRVGEYLVFDGLIEADGLKLPKTRSWHMNDDDRHLGNDIIEALAVNE